LYISLKTHLICFSLSSSKNPFVETSLNYALTYIHTLTPTSLRPTQITILADNDYYSHSSPSPTSPSLFTDFAVRLSDAHKTGLGSSAALVTSLTGALLSHYLPPDLFSLTTDVGRTILHNLAQTSHCAAQGKVGSGFDVAAAVYGTCVYRRFSPGLLSSLGDANAEGFSSKLKELVEDIGSEKKWDTEVKKEGINIPAGYALVMCDVDCGSQTVGMVKKVLSWRAVDSGSLELWAALQAANDALAASLAGGDAGVIAIKIETVRALIREMGTKSGVPIEPESQTELLDALTGLEGVVGGVVPGAGGFDAVVLLVKDDEDTKGRIETFLKEWSEKKQENVKLLDVKGEMEGVRREARDYGEWLN
jgi:phosphomevalonate kinase